MDVSDCSPKLKKKCSRKGLGLFSGHKKNYSFNMMNSTQKGESQTQAQEGEFKSYNFFKNLNFNKSKKGDIEGLA